MPRRRRRSPSSRASTCTRAGWSTSRTSTTRWSRATSAPPTASTAAARTSKTKAQLDRYAEPAEDRQEVLKNDVDALSAFSARTRNVDFAGRLILGENGEPTISFGKHKGRTAREVWETEPAYFAWIEGGDFTLDTKAQFARLKARFERERKEARAARQAALNRPATDDELASLRDKFSGKLF